MMTRASRLWVLVAALAMGLAYVLPLWRIDLEAPQYPEGLGMVIGLSTIEGKKPNDLANINNLNHYIGMKRIEPESIPELRIMPFVVAALILLGVVTSVLGRRRLLYLWVGLFLGVSVAGLADFWKWEYDYGHDLDTENAIIEVPGMSYQPPLIGSRQILNFTAHSWPAAGGLVLMVSCLLGVVVAVSEFRRARREPEHTRSGAASATPALAALVLVGVQGCSGPAPRPLQAGVDRCERCLMVLADEGHGAEVVTLTGRVYAFDSAECMVAFLDHDARREDVHSVWVTDFSNAPELVPAERAHYLVGGALASPMGLGITAFGRLEDRDGAVHAFGGRPVDWDGVRALVAERWPDGSPARGHGGHETTLIPTQRSGTDLTLSADPRAGG